MLSGVDFGMNAAISDVLWANKHFYYPIDVSFLFCMVRNYQSIADNLTGRPMAAIYAVAPNKPADRYKSFERMGTIIMLIVIDLLRVHVTGSLCPPLASRSVGTWYRVDHMFSADNSKCFTSPRPARTDVGER